MLDGIKLVRVDYRLIHGQVITKWRNTVSMSAIVIVNDELAADEFMADIYAMAAPPGVDVRVMTREAFIADAAAGIYDTGGTLVLFKNISDASYVVEKGVIFKQVQIGGLGSGDGRTMVVKGISVDTNDIQQLEAIASAGAEVTFQVTPEEQRLTLERAKAKVV